MPVIGGGTFRLFGVTLASEGPLTDGANVGPPDPSSWYCTNMGFFPTTPGLVQFNGPAFIWTSTEGVAPAGSPPAGFVLKTRPVFTGPMVRPVFTLSGINNESTWDFGGMFTVDSAAFPAGKENDDPLLTYIELLDPCKVNLIRLDGFPFSFPVCAKTGYSSPNTAGAAGTIEGGFEIVWWWWTRDPKDKCGNDQDVHNILAAEQPDSTYHKLDPEDSDAHPTPVITSVEPNHGPTAGGDSIVILGSGFGDDATVTVGGVAATSVVVVNEGRIECVTPAHAAGSANVVVTNPDGVSS